MCGFSVVTELYFYSRCVAFVDIILNTTCFIVSTTMILNNIEARWRIHESMNWVIVVQVMG